MDWNALLSTIAIVAFILLMMRGCGRMMTGGGCGMGAHHRRGRRTDAAGGTADHTRHDEEAR